MRHNIPADLRQLRQWVISGPDKIPRHPLTAAVVDPTDPAGWDTFEHACDSGYPNIGFCLHTEDPFTIIDLDKPTDDDQRLRHTTIYKAFQSYAEISQSGEGVHIIVRGRIPQGRRKDGVEVYSDQRYMICTGNKLNDYPVSDSQELLDKLYNEMPTTAAPHLLDQHPQTIDDEAILNTAHKAVNGPKFDRLWAGDFADYQSQSEADMALLTILAFYSRNDEQVRRLFRFSALGNRDKAHRDSYLNYGLARIRGKQAPLVDLSAFDQSLDMPNGASMQPELPGVEPPPLLTETPSPPSTHDDALPPGLVGDIARYIYSSAQRPVFEVALAGAIGLVAGLSGRCYNISNTGLNCYVIILAQTGRGKEAASIGVDQLVAAVRSTVPAIDDYIGPAAFASGQGVLRALDAQCSLVSILGEIGITLQAICDPRANSAELMFKRVLLDVYSKSGWTQVLRPTAYSDTLKNTTSVSAPNLTIIGESTPESFYAGLTPQHIAEGLIPRFLMLEYMGPRPPRNVNAGHLPSSTLTQTMSQFAACCVQMKMNHQCAAIAVDAGAKTLLDAYDKVCDAKMNSASADVDVQLWNRGHLKALKLAGLVAVGCNHLSPVVDDVMAQWAIELVTKDIDSVALHFHKGDIGGTETKQHSELMRLLEEYLASPSDEKMLRNYKVPKPLWGKQIVAYGYLSTRARRLSCYANDRMGAKRALDANLNSMIDSGEIQEIPPDQRVELKVRGRCFVLGNQGEP